VYTVVLSSKAKKQLLKLDKHTAKILTSWLRRNLEGCQNPYAKGKPLSGNRAGTWRYRIGSFRIIADILDNKLVILIIAVGDRKDVYE